MAAATEVWWSDLEAHLPEPVADDAPSAPLPPIWFTVAVSKADYNALLHCRTDCSVVLHHRKLFPLAPLMAHEPPIRGDELCATAHVDLWRRVCPLCASPALLRILAVTDRLTRATK